jgi:uracil phosphoribosyltransferase
MTRHLHATPEMAMIRDELTQSSHDISRVRNLLHEAFLIVLRRVSSRSLNKLIPIVVLRGGLLAYRSAAIVFGGPMGIVAPRGRPPYEQRTYGDVPLANHYLVIDTIANTGDTLVECVLALRSRFTLAEIQVAFLFGTPDACSKLEKMTPTPQINVAWPDFRRGHDGRLIGISYDAGDYAMLDTSGDRVLW